MLLILSLGLFPLGLVAILASVQSARDNNDKRAEQTLSQLEIEAQRLTALLSHSSGTIRAASTAIALTAVDSRICETTLQRLARAQSSVGRFALYGDNNVIRCATPGFIPFAVPRADGRRSIVTIGEEIGRASCRERVCQ